MSVEAWWLVGVLGILVNVYVLVWAWGLAVRNRDRGKAEAFREIAAWCDSQPFSEKNSAAVFKLKAIGFCLARARAYEALDGL